MGFVVVLFCLSLTQLISFHLVNAQQDPTTGFTVVSLSQSNFELHKPYDKPQNERYSLNNGVHRFWVFANDKPFMVGSGTKSRTEIRIRGYDYNSGVWQFEGQAYVPSGTTGTSIMQIFGQGGRSRNTTIMLRVYSGSLTVYRSPVVLANMYNRWFQVNVIHDKGASSVKVYIDRTLRYEGSDDGGFNHYFKFGVYTQNDPSNYMECSWRGIRVLRRN